MGLNHLYLKTQEICDLFEKRKRFSDLANFADPARDKKILQVVQSIIKRCPVACEFAMENKFFYRGVGSRSPKVQYSKPGLNRRVSRDNDNIWNVLFDNGPYSKQHQKRQYSLMFSSNEGAASEFGSVVYVFPVGNPTISYSPEDFIETIPIGLMETALTQIVRDLKIKDSYKRYLGDYIQSGKNFQRFVKILDFIEKAPFYDDDYKTHRFPWDKEERRNFMEAKLNGVLKEHVFKLLFPKGIEAMKLSDFDYFEDSTDEIWTEAPCYILDEDMVYKVKTTISKMKEND